MTDFKYDVYRCYGKYKENLLDKINRPKGLKYLKIFRKTKSNIKIIKLYYIVRLWMLQKKTFIQIPYKTSIGKGFYIGHEGRVIINPNTIIGENVNISTGVIIGQENRGKRKGTPVIGNEVWIGTNSVIVGKIKIGNNVLIAPLSFINFDVPDNSIVIGNPAKIIKSQSATNDYINNKI